MDTLQIIKDILKDNLDIEPVDVKHDSTLESLNIDSLDLVELVCDLEKRCDIQMGYPKHLNTIDDVIAYVDERRN